MTAAEPAAVHGDRHAPTRPGTASDPVCGMSVDPTTAR
jgi:hypothetical protein